jgi:hypothetical protein
VVHKHADQREPPKPRLQVNQQIPYIRNKEEDQRLESIQNHVKRRKPDSKLVIEDLQTEPEDDLAEELKYATNQRLLTPGNPFRYQILRSDFRASNSYQVHLLNAKERVTVKTYIP